MLTGGSFLSGALTGAAGSAMGSLTGLIPGIQTNGWGTAVQVGSSAAFGGIVAELSGGNFWNGATQAAIIAGFNHRAHKLNDGIEERRASRLFSQLEKSIHDHFYETGQNLAYRNGELKWETYEYLKPITGTPPNIFGGPLAKGDKAIKLGKYLLNPNGWHAIKDGFLTQVGRTSFTRIVGKNPDITFKGNQIFLTGTKLSGYYGKSYGTGITIKEFAKYFYNNF